MSHDSSVSSCGSRPMAAEAIRTPASRLGQYVSLLQRQMVQRSLAMSPPPRRHALQETRFSRQLAHLAPSQES